MNKLTRTLSLIATVLGIAAAVVVLSRVLLTLDAIETPALRIAYAVGVVLILAGGGLLVRRLALGPRRRTDRLAAPPQRTVEARLDRLFSKHRLEADPRDVALATKRLRPGEAAVVAITGLARTGKSRLAESLRAALVPQSSLPPVEIIETPALGTDFAANLETLKPALAAHLVLFVADQDLRDYEYRALAALIERGQSPIVVVNKADQRDSAGRTEIHAALRRRLAGLVPAEDIVDAAADPASRLQLTRDADGHEVESEVSRPADVARLLERLAKRLRP